MIVNEIDISKDHEALKILGMCASNTKYCAKAMFPGTFYSPFSSLHNAIFDAIDSKHRYIVIAAPRGLGKTSIAKLVAKKKILFRDSHFIPYVMNSATVAAMQTENIKRDLLTNRLVRGFFGNIKESDFEYAIDEQFSKEAWVAFGNTLVLPRGQGQQIRGLNWNDYRPDTFIFDDLEDKDEIRNKDNRDKLKEWFYSDAMKSVDFYRKDFQIVYIDTVKHEDSLLQELLDSPDWYGVRLSICDENYKSLDPNYMTDEEIDVEVREARRIGKLDIFYMERMNLPVAKEDASFKQEYFRNQDEVDLLKRNDLENVVIMDPAKTVKMQSADSAIVGISIDSKNMKIHVRDIVSKKMYPDEIYKEAFDMVERLNARVLGVEVTGLEEFIKQPVTNESSMRHCKAELIWLKARGGSNDEKGKVERIKGLIPYYRQGFVTHNPSCCGKLEQQLLSFPKSKLWDVMDATAYVVELMELGGRYFEGPDDEGSQDPSDDEYGDIVDDPEIKNWRVA